MSLNSLNIKSNSGNGFNRQETVMSPPRMRCRRFRRLCFAMIRIFCFAVLAVASVSGQSEHQGSSSIVGSVRDASGAPVVEASVRLQVQGEGRADDRKTDSDGSFGFPGLRAGTYLVSASKGERHSNEVTVTLVRDGAIQRVDLTISNSAGLTEEKDLKTEMEFSDAPNFTIAAVTDWTAAGGHGSDTSLRTTEALTRETLRLKPGAKSQNSEGPADSETEQLLRSRVERTPDDFSANEALGQFYLAKGRFSDALVLLEKSYALHRAGQRSRYDLALALAQTGNLKRARELISQLLSEGDKPEWHRLAGEISEKSGDPLNALREFEQAVKADPSEDNYFALGSELLQHRAIWQAKDVFASGVKAYPGSARLLTAFGAALFGAALYSDASRRLCEAADLNPTDPEPYLFMGKVEQVAPDTLPCIESRLQRFAEAEPRNPLANYYYAMAYWKEHGKRTDPATLEYVEGFLNKAVAADKNCSSAYLQLGVLQASRGNFELAAEFYRNAIKAQPESTEAHYRLGVAYDRIGEKQKAADEFSIHDRLDKEQAAEVDRQRREVKQFVVQAGGNRQDAESRP